MSATPKRFLALDFGAGSGRVMAVDFDGEQITIEEAHRFEGYAVSILNALHWNPLLMLGEALEGIARASVGNAQIAGIGVDTWGVDYGLLDANDRLIGLPYQYRDARNNGTMEESFSVFTKVNQWREAGIQFLPFNTLYQLIGEKRDHPEMLEAARTLLFMPDLLSFWLCGEKVQERSIASTSAFLNPLSGTWSEDMLHGFGLPSRLFGDITEPGKPIAQLRAIESRDRPMVMAVAGHDTASAFAGAPVRRPGTAILSSGTWSLLGLELDEPILSDEALAYGFSNEIGWGGSVHFLKNITGFWILQLLRTELAEKGEAKDFTELTALAQQAGDGLPLIDPDSPLFIAPGPIRKRIADYCHQSGQSEPSGTGEYARVIFQSLVTKVALVFAKLREVAPIPVDRLLIVGGGNRNEWVNQALADALRVPVETGPTEATSLGNAAAQMIGLGLVGSLDETRELIAASSPGAVYEPRDDQADRWAARLECLQTHLEKQG